MKVTKLAKLVMPLTQIILVICLSVILTGTAGIAGSAEPAVDDGADEAALRVFEERIMPIFKSPKPSSCVQCHLSSVDIKDYILPSHVETFLALRADGLIDVEKPEESKILKLIQMGEKDLDRGARLIHSRTRKAEYEAFASWIKACCRDPELRDAAAPAKIAKVGSEKPLEVVRHGRKGRLAESFSRNVWSQRMRCFPCHTPNELTRENPKHKMPIQRHGELVKKYGAKMNIFQETPEATMAKLIAGSRRHPADRYPLINVAEPSKSLLVLKPTSKLPKKKDDGKFEAPSSFDPVSHMGGLKMHVNDQSYKSFMLWLQDYADTVGGQYASVEDLPADNWTPTKRILRLKEVPESWGNLKVVQLFVYAADADGQWHENPIAFTQGLTTPRHMVNGALFLIDDESNGSRLASRRVEAAGDAAAVGTAGDDVASDDVASDDVASDDVTSDDVASDDVASDDVASDDVADGSVGVGTAAVGGGDLRPGKYLVKAYLDSKNRIEASPALLLGPEEFVGQVVIQAKWRVGFKEAQTVSAQALKKE